MNFFPGMRGGPWPNPWQQPYAGGNMGFPGSSVLPSLSVCVTSQRRAEVGANLTAGAEYGSLTADVPGLSGLSITREAGTVQVNLEVGVGQPSGYFKGCIRAGGREVGSLTVTIAEAEPHQQDAGGASGKSV